MTDLPPFSPVPDEHDADLLASLYLDGEATEEEVAMVEADALLMERVNELRAVADELARPVAPPVGLSRRQIDVALQAFSPSTTPDLHTSDVSSPGAMAAPISLAERRTRRALPSWLGAAAATLMVLGGIGFGLSRLGGSSDSDSASDLVSAEMRDGSEALSQDADAAASASTTTQAAEAETASAAEAGEAAADDAGDASLAPVDPESNSEGTSEEATETTEDTDEAGVDAKAFYEENGPWEVTTFEDITAIAIFETQPPLLPIDELPCFGSEAVDSLQEPRSYAPLLLDGEPATLVVFEGEPEPGTIEPSVQAVILDAKCEIILR